MRLEGDLFNPPRALFSIINVARGESKKLSFLWNCRSKPSDRADPMIGSREARRQAIVVFMELSFKTIGSGRSDDRIGGRRWSFLQNCRSKHSDPVVPSAGSFRPRRNALSARWIRQ